MQINIKTIPHAEQRYATVGDYWLDEGTLEIRVSDMGNQNYEYLVALHELVEAYFCMVDSVNFGDITAFDKHFEDMRESFPDLVQDMEPGDSEVAPYSKQHKIANMFEKWLADNMKVDWEAYGQAVNKLYEKDK